MTDSPLFVRHQGTRSPRHIRKVSVANWPKADREMWKEACRPHERLKRGGRAAHLALVTRKDLEARYGLFHGFLVDAGRFNPLRRRPLKSRPITWWRFSKTFAAG